MEGEWGSIQVSTSVVIHVTVRQRDKRKKRNQLWVPSLNTHLDKSISRCISCCIVALSLVILFFPGMNQSSFEIAFSLKVFFTGYRRQTSLRVTCEARYSCFPASLSCSLVLPLLFFKSFIEQATTWSRTCLCRSFYSHKNFLSSWTWTCTTCYSLCLFRYFFKSLGALRFLRLNLTHW